MGFGIRGFGLGVQGLRRRVRGFGLKTTNPTRFWAWGSRFLPWGSGFGAEGSRFRVENHEPHKVLGLGSRFRAEGSRFWAPILEPQPSGRLGVRGVSKIGLQFSNPGPGFVQDAPRGTRGAIKTQVKRRFLRFIRVLPCILARSGEGLQGGD